MRVIGGRLDLAFPDLCAAFEAVEMPVRSARWYTNLGKVLPWCRRAHKAP